MFGKILLTENMRVLPNEVEFATYLLDVGNGTLNTADDLLELPEHCILSPQDDLIETVFGKLIREKNYEEISKCAILSAHNADIDEINKKVVELLDKNTEHIYTAIDSTENCDNGEELNEALSPEYLNTLNPSSLPPHELRLRKNCIVMLIRNLSTNEQLCNGTRLRVIDFSNHLLKCKILTGDKAGVIVFLNRITLYSKNEYPFTFRRRQFPV